MAVPRRKTSPSRRGMRRSADALKAPAYVEDKDSGELRRPHHIDLKSGMYRGRQVLKPKSTIAEVVTDAGLKTGRPRLRSAGGSTPKVLCFYKAGAARRARRQPSKRAFGAHQDASLAAPHYQAFMFAPSPV